MRQWEIQVSIYEELTGYYHLSSMVGDRIYDRVPQNSDYPYLVLGDDTSLPWDTDNTTGSENTLTLHVWSRYYGRKEVKDIMKAIYDCLHRKNIEVSGAHTVLCQHEFSESFLDPDGITTHGVIRFRIIIDYRYS